MENRGGEFASKLYLKKMMPSQMAMAQVFKLLATQGPCQNVFNGDHFWDIEQQYQRNWNWH